jgi:hypothetical protein
MSDCRFDDSLPRLLRILVDKLGVAQVEAGVVLRDASGHLGFFANVDVDSTVVREIDDLARASLGSYARPDRLLVRASDPGAQRVLQDSDLRDPLVL